MFLWYEKNKGWGALEKHLESFSKKKKTCNVIQGLQCCANCWKGCMYTTCVLRNVGKQPKLNFPVLSG